MFSVFCVYSNTYDVNNVKFTLCTIEPRVSHQTQLLEGLNCATLVKLKTSYHGTKASECFGLSRRKTPGKHKFLFAFTSSTRHLTFELHQMCCLTIPRFTPNIFVRETRRIFLYWRSNRLEHESDFYLLIPYPFLVNLPCPMISIISSSRKFPLEDAHPETLTTTLGTVDDNPQRRTLVEVW